MIVIAGPLAVAGAPAPATSGRAPGRDLTVRAGSYNITPFPPHVNDQCTVNFTVENVGTIDVGASFNVSFYLNNTTTPLAPDEHHNTTINGLNTGASVNVSCVWNTLGLAPGINYTILIIVDQLDSVFEGDETNNTLSQNQSLLAERLVDLYPSAIALDPPAPQVGDQVLVTATVNNQGEKTAPFCDVFFYLNNTTVAIGMYNTTTEVNLTAGKNVTNVWDTTGVEPGDYEILVIVNPSWAINRQNENDTTNNELRLPVTLSKPQVLLDLLYFNITPAAPHQGDTVTVNCTVRNNGTRAISTAPARLLHGDDILLNTTFNLSVGESTSLATDIETAALVPGNITLVLLAGNLNESRNFTLLDPRLPDLAVRNVSYLPLKPRVGQAIVVTVQLANDGEFASGPCNLSLMLDWNITPVAVAAVPAMMPAEVKSFQLTVDTTGYEARNHTLRVTADSDGILVESNKTNNAMAVTIEFIGELDLTVENVSYLPAAPRFGETASVTFQCNVLNIGTLRSTGANLTLKVGGLLYDTKNLTALSAGGTLTNVTLKWPTAGLAAGKFGFEVRVTAGPNETDINATNDFIAGQIELLPPLPMPDLRVRSVGIVPPTPRVGDDFTLVITVENIGTANASACNLTVSREFTGGSSLLTDTPQQIPELPAGGAVTVNLTRTVNFKAGTYLLNVTVDSSKDVVESNETNNIRTASLQVLEPPEKKPALRIHGIVLEGVPEVDAQVTVTVVVNNTGDADATDVLVTLTVDGKTAGTYRISFVGKGSSGTAPFKCSFSKGKHTVSATANAAGATQASGSISVTPETPATEMNWYLVGAGLLLLVLLMAAVAYRAMATGRAPGPRVKLIEEEE